MKALTALRLARTALDVAAAEIAQMRLERTEIEADYQALLARVALAPVVGEAS